MFKQQQNLGLRSGGGRGVVETPSGGINIADSLFIVIPIICSAFAFMV